MRSPPATQSSMSGQELYLHCQSHLSQLSNLRTGGRNQALTALTTGKREHLDALPSFPEPARDDKKFQVTSSPSWKYLRKGEESSKAPPQEDPPEGDSLSKLQRYVSLQEIKTTDQNQPSLQSTLEVTLQQQQDSNESIQKPETNTTSSHKVAGSSRHSPEFEFENLQPDKFEESVLDMPDLADIERKVSQKMQIYEAKQSQRREQAQQTDLTVRRIREQKDSFDNMVQNFDYIREVVRKYIRLDISSGYKHTYDQKQKDKINQKFEQKTAINMQTEKIVETL